VNNIGSSKISNCTGTVLTGSTPYPVINVLGDVVDLNLRHYCSRNHEDAKRQRSNEHVLKIRIRVECWACWVKANINKEGGNRIRICIESLFGGLLNLELHVEKWVPDPKAVNSGDRREKSMELYFFRVEICISSDFNGFVGKKIINALLLKNVAIFITKIYETMQLTFSNIFDFKCRF
jgi:hypothetical protein